jgi:polysaccharide export outer membrane protein
MKPSGLTPAVAGACCVSLLTVAALLSVPARVAAQAPVVAQAPAQAPSPTPTQAVQPAPVQAAQPAPTTKGTLTPADLGGVDTPPDYVIGPDDLLSIVFWREKEMSAEVAVRPDGMISLPLVNDVKAAGLTPEQLRAKVSEAASRFS